MRGPTTAQAGLASREWRSAASAPGCTTRSGLDTSTQSGGGHAPASAASPRLTPAPKPRLRPGCTTCTGASGPSTSNSSSAAAALPGAPFSTTTTEEAPSVNTECTQPLRSGPASWSTTTTPIVPGTPRSVLPDKAELDQRLHGAEAVAPRDLLSFAGLATRIGDRHLVNPVAPPEDLGRDFRFELEAVRHDGDVLEHLGVEELVTGLHVREGRAVQHVGQQRQHAVPDPMQREHVLPLAGEPAAVDDERLAAQDRVEQLGPVVGVVFQVGVLKYHQV